jgi:hypothetical protein
VIHVNDIEEDLARLDVRSVETDFRALVGASGALAVMEYPEQWDLAFSNAFDGKN